MVCAEQELASHVLPTAGEEVFLGRKDDYVVFQKDSVVKVGKIVNTAGGEVHISPHEPLKNTSKLTIVASKVSNMIEERCSEGNVLHLITPTSEEAGKIQFDLPTAWLNDEMALATDQNITLTGTSPLVIVWL